MSGTFRLGRLGRKFESRATGGDVGGYSVEVVEVCRWDNAWAHGVEMRGSERGAVSHLMQSECIEERTVRLIQRD